MNNNFSANLLIALQNSAQKVFDDLITDLKQIQMVCNEMGSLVSSEDSGLASRWNSISSSLQTPVINSDKTFSAIFALLTKYVQQTIANEEQANADLQKADQEIQELGESANQIVDLSGAINAEIVVPPHQLEPKPNLVGYELEGISTVYGPPLVGKISEAGTTTIE